MPGSWSASNGKVWAQTTGHLSLLLTDVRVASPSTLAGLADRRAAVSDRSPNADDLPRFALRSDELLYGTGPTSSVSHVPDVAPVANGHTTQPAPLNDLTAFVGLAVVNNYANLDALYVHLAKVKLDDTERLRPGWDRYFMVRLLQDRTLDPFAKAEYAPMFVRRSPASPACEATA